MDLLLCIVEANAAAKALANAAAQSLHAVDDCACIVEFCTKVLPAALSALEGAASTSEDAVAKAIECVQGCNAAMTQLQLALESLNEHDSEGVLGVLLEHPAAWLDTYRGFRGLTSQLVNISCFVRAAAQRGQADGADEGLQAATKALMATCTRSRDAANLLGSDLPDFARTAAAAGWSAVRVRCALRGRSLGDSSPDCTPRCDSGRQRTTTCVTSAAAGALAQQGQVIAEASVTHQQQQQRMSLLRRISKAAACSTPAVIRVRRGGGAGATVSDDTSCSSAAEGASCASLDAVAVGMVVRIQDTILYDSEIDQLDQDQAYLRQRVGHLREFCGGCGGSGGMSSGVATTAAAPQGAAGEHQEAVAAALAATESLIQSEILLEAVEAQLKVLADREDSSGEGCRRQLQAEGRGGWLCGRGEVVPARRMPAAGPGRLVDAEDLYDDVRKRRSGLRWLPVCFVGA